MAKKKDKREIGRKKGMTYEELREYESRKVIKTFSVVLLIIMGLSVIGFSIIGTPTIGGGGDGTQRNVPFTQNLFSDGAGNTFDGAILNGIQFVFFEDITPYREDENLISLSNELLSHRDGFVQEFVDGGFTNDNARLLISQGLSVNSITLLRTQELNCQEEPTLVFTTNSSAMNQSLENCMIFEAQPAQAQSLSYGLVYHLIKDVR